MRTTMLLALATLLGPAVTAASAQPKPKPSWPLFGGTPGRNIANTVERNIPIDWCVEEGKRKNIKWVAELGSHTYGSPTVAGGKVYVATNNDTPRDPKLKGHKAVLMAFREADGVFLWQTAHNLPFAGLLHRECPSRPTVDGGKLYYFTSNCEVVCADADTGEVHWRYSTIQEVKVQPGRWYCFAPPLASPLVIGYLVFSVTGNGPDWKGKLVAEAPSFVALNKRIGKLVWQSNRTFAQPFRWTYTGRPVKVQQSPRPRTWRERWVSKPKTTKAPTVAAQHLPVAALVALLGHVESMLATRITGSGSCWPTPLAVSFCRNWLDRAQSPKKL